MSELKVSCVGDILMTTSPSNDYWNNPLIQTLIESDLRIGNLEMCLCAGKSHASTFCGGAWLSSDEDRIEDIKRFGINHLNLANNHTMDFAIPGANETCRVLDKNNIPHSGYGQSLSEANSASILEIKNKKIAIISCVSSCDDSARAGNATKSVPSRPGMNVLRFKQTLYIEHKYTQAIDEIAQKTNINARFNKSVKMGIHSIAPNIHKLGRLEFIESNETYKETSCNKNDLSRICDEVNRANSICDYVFVNIHSHDIRGSTDDTPDNYVEEFAHACIDAGATAIIGTGTHQIKAIEIYKGKPIFYSLGNFCFKDELMYYLPSDFYERYDLDESLSAEEIWDKISHHGSIGLEYDKANYLSFVPEIRLDDEKVTGIELLPIELGSEAPKDNRQKGFPYVANSSDSAFILERLKDLSDEYGTSFDLRNGRIIVTR